MATVKLYAHLACGRPATASNAASRIAWSYDGAGRPINETCSLPGLSSAQSALSVALDASGLPTNTHLNVESCALSVERSFDPAARLTTQTTEAGAFAWSYTPWNGLPAAITNAASGIQVEYAYDILDRTTNICWRTANGDTLRSFGYNYDLSGLITQQVTAGQTFSPVTNLYAYDGLGRLVSADSVTNTYDLAGNRLAQSGMGVPPVEYSYTHNRLIDATDGTALAYDAAGCVTNMVRDGVTLSLAWNSQHRLIAVSTNGTFAESYTYDAIGRRISTTDSGGTVFHIYDGDECMVDVNASGKPLRTYAWGPGIDNLLAVTVYVADATNTYYAIKDHLGSVHALVDHQGQVVESYTYDAWGNVLLGVSAIGNRYLWQGREYSFATDLYHFRARWYEPATGRWLSNDPIGISGGLNQYVFCHNDPVNVRDPDGRAPWMLIGAAIGGGLDLAVQLAQGRSFSEVNWVSVGAGAASGALGAGLGANIARLTASIAARAALNAVGSAVIGAGVQTARNAIEGKRLGTGVGNAAVVSGVLGGLGSVGGDLLERGVVSTSQNSRFIQGLLDNEVLYGTRPGYLLPGEVLPPSAGSTAGTALGLGISNLGPLVPSTSSEPCP